MSADKPVGPRHLARRTAVQTLYWLHSQPWDGMREVVRDVAEENGLPPKAERHALELCQAAEQRQGEHEGLLAGASANWDADRIGRLERIIIRLALAEWDLERTDTPPKVVLNEAVTLARDFCGEDAAKFVNGVLDRLGHEANLLGSGGPGGKAR